MAKGFQKGNKLAKANAGRMGPRKKMFAEVSDQLISLSPTYNEKLVAMSDGQKLSDPEREFMDRFEKMFEFARPKLARSVVVGDKENPLEVTFNLSPEQFTVIAAAASRISGDTGAK